MRVGKINIFPEGVCLGDLTTRPDGFQVLPDQASHGEIKLVHVCGVLVYADQLGDCAGCPSLSEG